MQTVDDTDPRLLYSGSWLSVNDSHYYNRSAHVSQRAGSSITFTFKGTFVNVTGTSNGTQGVSKYTLDNGTAAYVTYGGHPTPVYNVSLYVSPKLNSDVKHTLIIETVPGNSYFCFDFIGYMPSGGSSSSGLGTVNTSHISKAGIAGIAVGTVVGLLASLFLVFALCKHKRKTAGATTTSPVPMYPINTLESKPTDTLHPSYQSQTNWFQIRGPANNPVSHAPQAASVEHTNYIRDSENSLRSEESYITESSHGLSWLEGYVIESNESHHVQTSPYS